MVPLGIILLRLAHRYWAPYPPLPLPLFGQSRLQGVVVFVLGRFIVWVSCSLLLAPVCRARFCAAKLLGLARHCLVGEGVFR